MKVAILLVAVLLLNACAKTLTIQENKVTNEDPFLWLEEVEGQKALDWVRERNESSLKILKQGQFEPLFADLKAITTAKDRIPMPGQRGGQIYNFWQDSEHQLGIWRKTTVAEFEHPAKAKWDTVLDLDALAKKESKKWAWHGPTCLGPEEKLCMLQLSDGGKDASVFREFDLSKQSFVENGFQLPEAKSNVTWRDQNTLVVGTDFGPGSMTSSGYPRVVKLWKRNTPLKTATPLFEGKETDVEIAAFSSFTATSVTTIVSRAITFFSGELYHVTADNKLAQIPVPIDFDFKLLFGNKAIGLLRTDWKGAKRTLTAGSLVAFPVEGKSADDAEVVFQPNAKQGITEVTDTKDSLVIAILDNVKGRVLQAKHGNHGWQMTPVKFPDNGNITIASSDEHGPVVFFTYEDFLTPTSLYVWDASQPEKAPKLLQKLPEKFVAHPFEVKQFEATSNDGTKVPYFLIQKKNLKLDGSNPTILYGYGGFEVSSTPRYLDTVGKAWLERGGTYAIANIRGGGEFGPKWHQAALKENRQRAFDDFASVAKDLIARKITSPRHLGIHGGSNGGLLVGATYTQHPELFNAVVCQVPLLDMLRYHKLLAGASWMGEYGNPDVPAEAAYIRKYSPYQNLKAEVKYPKVFFATSTKDDRVHPGHARKMAARMEAFNQPYFYFERIVGGHGGSVTPIERAETLALIYNYALIQLK